MKFLTLQNENGNALWKTRLSTHDLKNKPWCLLGHIPRKQDAPFSRGPGPVRFSESVSVNQLFLKPHMGLIVCVFRSDSSYRLCGENSARLWFPALTNSPMFSNWWMNQTVACGMKCLSGQKHESLSVKWHRSTFSFPSHFLMLHSRFNQKENAHEETWSTSILHDGYKFL